ncbi:hypothetical protein AB1K54_07395 [Microbacterium sp. BWT-B31]|uniref:hypothetical protein n=1 Tax=Microbacterium sp. BWT-B31 TaxID=3232072 RepID=UPI003529C4E0
MTLVQLRVVRVRAYRPTADIDRGPSAPQRLRELEALHSARSTSSSNVVDAAQPTHVGVGGECVTVMETELLPEEDADTNNWSGSGSIYSGCRVGGLPATVELPVDSSTPEELRSHFPTAARGSSCAMVIAWACS